MRASRHILVHLIDLYDSRYYSKRTGEPDVRPEGVFITYRPPENADQKGRYDNGVITLYRRGVDPDDPGGPLAAAAGGGDATAELIYLSHELGHHYSALLGHNTEYDAARPMESFCDEVRAWEIGRRLLASNGFLEWEAFDQIEEACLLGYQQGPRLDAEEAATVAAALRNDLMWKWSEPSSPALNTDGRSAPAD